MNNFLKDFLDPGLKLKNQWQYLRPKPLRNLIFYVFPSNKDSRLEFLYKKEQGVL